MMNNLYRNILEQKTKKKKMLAVLLDPEKCVGEVLRKTLAQLEKTLPDLLLIGGSSKSCSTNALLTTLQTIKTPKILFPGDASQFSEKADGILFLSLISGRNSDYLIGQHVQSALQIKASRIEVIPTGYILIDGGTDSSVSRISQTRPIAADDIQKATATAVAGELLGMKAIYLEAGSGAKNPVVAEMIATVKKHLDIPLIVGGGIKSKKQLKTAFEAGADLVVVGNIFESDPNKINEFVNFTRDFNSEER